MTMRPAHRLCFLILALTAACAACALPKTTPVKPPPDGGMAQRAYRERPKAPEYVAPQLAIGQEGRLYLVWLAVEWRKSWDSLFSRSEDFGATWSQPISFKPEKSTVAGGIRIATGPSGIVYAAWREWDPKIRIRHLQFVRSQDHGVHWDDPPRLLSAPSDVGMPQLLADQGGGVYFASLVGPRDLRALGVASSHDSGTTFPSEPARLTAAFPTSQHGITNHHFASDGRGHLYVVWEEIKSLRDQRIYLTRSLDQGKTWATHPILVSTPEEGEHRAHSPQIITAPEGRVYVAWEQDELGVGNREQPGEIRKADRVIYVNRSLDYGLTWLPQPIRLNETGQGPVASLWPQLSADQKGNVYAIWSEEGGSNRTRLLFTRSTDFGKTWSAPRVRLDLSSPFKGSLANPEIRSDDAGHVWVLWQEMAPGPRGWQLLIDRSEDHGESWGEQATALTGPRQRGGRARDVSFLNDMHGRLYVAWDGGPENSEEIFFNRSTDFGATWLSREVRVGGR
jgi:hypothetical protein